MHSDRLCLSSISVDPGVAGDAFGDPAGGPLAAWQAAGGEPPARCTCSVTTAVSIKGTASPQSSPDRPPRRALRLAGWPLTLPYAEYEPAASLRHPGVHDPPPMPKLYRASARNGWCMLRILAHATRRSAEVIAGSCHRRRITGTGYGLPSTRCKTKPPPWSHTTADRRQPPRHQPVSGGPPFPRPKGEGLILVHFPEPLTTGDITTGKKNYRGQREGLYTYGFQAIPVSTYAQYMSIL